VHCAVSRSTPVPFSVSASASAESLSASTAEDACPGVGVTHGCVTSFTSTEGDSIFTPCALHTCRSPATPSWARPLCLHYARLPSTPSSRPTSPRPPRLLHGSIHLVSQTLRRGAGGRLAKPNTPAQYIYISKNTCIHVPQPNSTGSCRTQRKIRPRGRFGLTCLRTEMGTRRLCDVGIWRIKWKIYRQHYCCPH